MFQIIKDILSEKTNASCMRFCVMVIVLTIAFNWVAGTIASIFLGGTMEIKPTEVVSVISVLVMKRWQKSVERSKGE